MELSNEDTKQESWADIIRCFLIVITVTGHYFNNTSLQQVIYCFHMPCFAILSGYLHWDRVITVDYLVRKVAHYLVPYFVYCFCFNIVYYRLDIFENICTLLVGSAKFQSGVSWYLPTFCLAWLGGVLLINLSGNKREILALSVFLIATATILSNLIKVSLPWNADVSVIMCGYFIMGYSLKEHYKNEISGGGIMQIYPLWHPLYSRCIDEGT